MADKGRRSDGKKKAGRDHQSPCPVPGVEPRGTRRWSRISEFRLFSPRLRAHTRVFAPLQIVKDQPRAPGATEAADGPPIAQHLILPHIYGISNSFLNYFCNPLAHVSRRADEGAEGKGQRSEVGGQRSDWNPPALYLARRGKLKLRRLPPPPGLWRTSPPLQGSGTTRTLRERRESIFFGQDAQDEQMRRI